MVDGAPSDLLPRRRNARAYMVSGLIDVVCCRCVSFIAAACREEEKSRDPRRKIFFKSRLACQKIV
jgi:hypothetical protein